MTNDPTTDDELFRFDLQLFAEGDELGSDEGGNEDDTTEETEEDDLDLGEFDLPKGDEDDAGKKKDDEPDYKTEAAKARARADALEEQLARDREERERTEGLRVVPDRTQAQQDQRPPVKRRSIEEIVGDDFDQVFISDPKGAIRKVLSEYDRDREAVESSRSVIPGASVLDNLADRFLRDQRDENPEEYALAAKAFRQLLEETPAQYKAQLAQQPAAALQKMMQQSWDASYAQGLRDARKKGKQSQSQRRGADPPAGMGGGRGTQGSGARASGGGTTKTRFTSLELDMIARGKAGGLNEKDIKDMIAEHRAEQRELRGA